MITKVWCQRMIHSADIKVGAEENLLLHLLKDQTDERKYEVEMIFK